MSDWVWLLEQPDDDTPVGIFSTRKKAEQYADEIWPGDGVRTYDSWDYTVYEVGLAIYTISREQVDPE